VDEAVSDLWVVYATRHWRRDLSRWLARSRRGVTRWLRWGTRHTSRDYERFMRSPAWAEQRRRVLRRDGYRCRDCFTAKATEAHHSYYLAPLEATPDEAIASLCEPCHLRRHRVREHAPTSKKLW
jgi:5-methylcytosine-specific restriction endonuclease McrA